MNQRRDFVQPSDFSWVVVSSALLLLLFTRGVAGAQSPDGPGPNAVEPDKFLKDWLIMKPIPVPEEGQNSLDEETQQKAFTKDWFAEQGGEANLHPRLGQKHTVRGRELEWKSRHSKSEVIDLKTDEPVSDYAVAYAWCDIEAPQTTNVFLGLGSDDGVKVWVNGKLVHENWIGRRAEADTDVVPVELRSGKNQVLLKIQNRTGDWGFVCRVLSEQTLAEKLITLALGGADIDAIKALLDKGVNVNSRGPAGITVAIAARLRGETELLNFLASRGADVKATVPPREALADVLLQRVVREESAGLAVLVSEDGKILFEKGYGLADIEHKVPTIPETKFRIGSITKQFTAVAILKLQEEGKLSVNDKLSKYLPDFPRGDEVQLHHLLTHTSGIRSYTDKPGFMDTVTKPVKAEELISSFKNEPFDFDPGKKWHYDNSGYFLLGYIIEKVSGQSYGEFMCRRFFEPFSMTNTGVHRAGAALEHEALGYKSQGEGFAKAVNWDMSRAGGAGALYSTVEDLYRWNEALFHQKVVSQTSLQAAWTPVKTEEDKDNQATEAGYGYGWAINQIRGAQEISHGGGLNGFSSFLMRLPKYNFTVAVLANALPAAPGVDPARLAHLVTEIYLGDKLEPRSVPVANKSISLNALDAVVGRYDYGGAILTVTRQDSHLYAQLTGQPRFEIFPKSETDYFWKVVDARVSFLKDSSGKVTKAVHHQNGMTINAARLEDVAQVKVDPASYDALVGKYDYGKRAAILTVTRDGERLFAQMTGQAKFEIFPKSPTEFYWKVVNADVTFVKDATGKVTKAIHRQAGQTLEAPKLE